MKKAWLALAVELAKIEGEEVFCFLAENLHPYWPEARFGPVPWLKVLKSDTHTNEELLDFIEKNKARRWPHFTDVVSGLPDVEYQKMGKLDGKWGLVSLASVVGDSGKGAVAAATKEMEPL